MVTRKRKIVSPVLICVMVVTMAAGLALVTLAATQTDIAGPPGSEQFGKKVTVLPNGNIVVTDPSYDAPGPITDTGAVYLYDGATGALISRLTGSQTYDLVGIGGVVTLTNGNYVIVSHSWGDAVGAVTWGNGTTGITGVVTVTNSLVGGQAGDGVGYGGVARLTNGNYVVRSPVWHNGAATDAGAVTWGNGATGITGVVTLTNSLVGGAAYDNVGNNGVTALSNGNYMVLSPYWDNGAATSAGAATWGNGTTGIKGVVTVTNSLVGSTAGDRVGSGGVAALSNGNYVVGSPYWDNGAATDAGAVTWGRGTTGITGAVTVTNSLVGNAAGDQIGYGGVTALTNGNYVVSSQWWDNGAAASAGAATWGNGTTGITGAVTLTNSLVGSAAGDQVGRGGVTALSNGNYVVGSTYWHNGAAASAGAATWANGTTGITGIVTSTNSLVGSTANDYVGWGVTALTNGNYVIASPGWDDGAVTDIGAATWANGTTGITGVVTTANSMVGGTAGDMVGRGGVTALTNGNYVVSSHWWANGAATYAGAVTWGNGTTGITGVVTTTNSLVGSTAYDHVGCSSDEPMDSCGAYGPTALTNGNYVVSSPWWDNGIMGNAGAATWGNGTTGIRGVVTSTNSLVGSTAGDRVGYGGVTALSNGHYVVLSPSWDNGATVGAGAVTLGDGSTGTVGPIMAKNSVYGAAANGGYGLNFGYDYAHDQLVVGRPADNIVTLLAAYIKRIYLPVVIKGG